MKLYRRLTLVSRSSNIIGAFLIFFYFHYVNVEADLEIAETDFGMALFFVALLIVLSLVGSFWIWLWMKPIIKWYDQHAATKREVSPSEDVQRRVLNTPGAIALISTINWSIAGLAIALYKAYFSAAQARVGVFFSVLISTIGIAGLVTVVVDYLVVEMVLRRELPLFFPKGNARAVHSFRLPLMARVLLFLLLGGIMPLIILAVLSYNHAGLLMRSSDPAQARALLRNLELFIIFTSALVSVGLARFLTQILITPIHNIRAAMSKVEGGNLNVSIPAFSNDELGELADSFNRMIEGLREKRRMEQDLFIASRIQRSMLPQAAPHIPNLQIVGQCLPARETSGDFFDYLWLPDGKLGIIIADVMGKSIPAALMAVNTRAQWRAAALHTDSPAQVLSEISAALYASPAEKILVTAIYAILDPLSRVLVFSNAGHLYPYFIAPAGAIEWEDSGPPLGAWEKPAYEDNVITLSADMSVLFYTDGLIEAFNSEGEIFGSERLSAVLSKEQNASPEMLMHKVYTAVTRFAAGHDLEDDATVVAFRLRG